MLERSLSLEKLLVAARMPQKQGDDETLGAWARWRHRASSAMGESGSDCWHGDAVAQFSSEKKRPLGTQLTRSRVIVCVCCEATRPFWDCGQVSQCTTTKFRDEPEEEQRWLKAEMVVVAFCEGLLLQRKLMSMCFTSAERRTSQDRCCETSLWDEMR